MVGWPVACVIALGCAPTIHRDKATPISTNDSYARHPSAPQPPSTRYYLVIPPLVTLPNEFPLCSHRFCHRFFFFFSFFPPVRCRDFANNPKTQIIETFDARSIVNSMHDPSEIRSTGRLARRKGRRRRANRGRRSAVSFGNRVPRHFSVHGLSSTTTPRATLRVFER